MRLIDKDALMDDIATTIENSGCVNHEKEILDCVEFADTIDAAEVVRGEWIRTRDENGISLFAECSNCHRRIETVYQETNYCHSCGAKMEDA